MTLSKKILNILPDSIQNIIHNYKRKVEIRGWNKSDKTILAPLAIKENIIRKYKELYAIDTFIETGTYYGDMVWRQRNNFNRIYSIELGIDLAHFSEQRFKNKDHITIIQGDSGKKLPLVLNNISTKAIIFLDAHYSGFDSVRGNKDCAVSDELPSILRSEQDHIIIISDAHLFKGERDYPTIDAIHRYILSPFPKSKISIEDDCIIIELVTNNENITDFETENTCTN